MVYPQIFFEMLSDGHQIWVQYMYDSVIRLEFMPMHRLAPRMVKQCAIAAGNVPNRHFYGPETCA